MQACWSTFVTNRFFFLRCADLFWTQVTLICCHFPNILIKYNLDFNAQFVHEGFIFSLKASCIFHLFDSIFWLSFCSPLYLRALWYIAFKRWNKCWQFIFCRLKSAYFYAKMAFAWRPCLREIIQINQHVTEEKSIIVRMSIISLIGQRLTV